MISSPPEYSIFVDPRGRRRRWLQGAVLLATVLLLSAATYLISSLLVAPRLVLPKAVRTYRPLLKAFQDPGLLESQEDWHRFLRTADSFPSTPLTTTNLLENCFITVNSEHQEHRNLSHSPFPTRLAYAALWDPQSLFSIKEHAGYLTHVAVEWFNIADVEGTLLETPNEEIRSLCNNKNLALLPILKNSDGKTCQPEAIEGLFKTSEEEQNSFFHHLIKRMPPGARGLLVDWNELDPSYRSEISELLLKLGHQLHEAHLEFWLTIPTDKAERVYDLEELSPIVDYFLLSLDDQHEDPQEAGPLAEQDWVEEELHLITRYGHPSQWIAGIGVDGLDWNESKETVEKLSFVDVMARANLATAEHVSAEPPHYSPSFHYLGGPDEREEHEIWFLDAITFFNQLQAITPYHLGGIAINRLGQEDPGIWDVLRWRTEMEKEGSNLPSPLQCEQLELLNLNHEVASLGTGDFLSVGDEPSSGWRRIHAEPNGLMSSLYEYFPRPVCIYHQGAAPPHQVALTFDDGPDPIWTPEILRILKEKKVPAAFFVVGSQAQQFPDLVQQILIQGHELGNHTYTHPNLAEISEEQIELQLNATTRLIESITGHSTSLFRPPYNSDATPTTLKEIRALSVASDLGYLTVGESIDAGDWECPGVETILERVKEERAAGGSILLLHDAGGNRAQTVAALPKIIDYFHARGDQIVPLGHFIGLPNNILMPPVRHAEMTVAVRYIYGSFATLRFVELLAWTLLIIVTLCSLLFIVFLVTCAFIHRQEEKKLLMGNAPPSPSLHEERSSEQQHQSDGSASLEKTIHQASSPPALSVIIAAYNEERVIDSTIEHLLSSDYQAPIELIIIDDGSEDKTAERVKNWANQYSTAHRRVLFEQQPNGGKASALNRAIELSHYDYIITLDADTMVSKQALRFLVEPLTDSTVGAVSGHIRVGNFSHPLGRFQQIEYEFAFEVNRRAQDLLNCITVVPGALSAFRREALLSAGPLNKETLAEDTDLTLQLHRLGWRITYAPSALADTEAPQHLHALFSQRFRWAFGTLQCMWKHRQLLFSPGSGWLGWLALPSVWVFQLGVIALTPILDFLVLLSISFGHGKAIYPYFLLSLFLDCSVAALSAHLAKRSAWSAWRAIPMRFLYRPVLGYVVWKSLLKAAAGSWVRWKKLERTAAAIQQKRASNAHPAGPLDSRVREKETV